MVAVADGVSVALGVGVFVGVRVRGITVYMGNVGGRTGRDLFDTVSNPTNTDERKQNSNPRTARIPICKHVMPKIRLLGFFEEGIIHAFSTCYM